jgi:hypothetical protein
MEVREVFREIRTATKNGKLYSEKKCKSILNPSD